MKEINLSLSIEEINLILEAVGNMPYVRVYELVNKIQQQAGSQLKTNENFKHEVSQSVVQEISGMDSTSSNTHVMTTGQ